VAHPQTTAEAKPTPTGSCRVPVRSLDEPPGSGATSHHPVAGELSLSTPLTEPYGERHKRHDQLAEQRRAAEQRCRDALADRPRLLAEFDRLLTVSQHYPIIREEQARDFTLAWPVLRTCAQRLGAHLAAEGAVATPADVFFCTRDEVHTAIASGPAIEMAAVGERRLRWQRQCRLPAPLTIGRPPRVIGDIIDRTADHRPPPAGHR
jgi:rifampicin phosphotransferase